MLRAFLLFALASSPIVAQTVTQRPASSGMVEVRDVTDGAIPVDVR